MRQSGHSFGFYGIATDHVGLSQAMPLTAQATTKVSLPTPPPPSPPPPVIVTSVHWETIKVKVGNSKRARTKSETALEIQFSGLVAGTGELAAYQLSSVTTRRVKTRAVTSYKPIRLTSAVPASNPMTSMVSLLPAIKPNLSQSDRILIIAADLTDTYGRPIDGNDDGVPGGNYVAIVTKNGGTAAAVAAPATMMARAVDAVLQPPGSFLVIRRLRGMLAAVELDDQSRSVRDEVDDVRADWLLAAELRADEPVRAEVFPEQPLGIGHVATELASEVAGHRTLSLTLPREGGGNGKKPSPAWAEGTERNLPPHGHWYLHRLSQVRPGAEGSGR